MRGCNGKVGGEGASVGRSYMHISLYARRANVPPVISAERLLSSLNEVKTVRRTATAGVYSAVFSRHKRPCLAASVSSPPLLCATLASPKSSGTPTSLARSGPSSSSVNSLARKHATLCSLSTFPARQRLPASSPRRNPRAKSPPHEFRPSQQSFQRRSPQGAARQYRPPARAPVSAWSSTARRRSARYWIVRCRAQRDRERQTQQRVEHRRGNSRDCCTSDHLVSGKACDQEESGVIPIQPSMPGEAPADL